MAWSATGGDSGHGGSKTANQASTTVTSDGSGFQLGNIVVLIVAVDNNQTTDGDEGAVSSVTDSVGNTWTKIVEFCNGQGAAQGGATVSVWWTQVTVAGASVVTTVNFTNAASRDASGIVSRQFTPAAGSTAVVAQTPVQIAVDGADPASMTISSLASQEYLFVQALAGEGPSDDAYTDPTNYTAFTGLAAGTTGGGAASNMHAKGWFRILSGTGDTADATSTTADRDYAQVYFALKEVLAATLRPPSVIIRQAVKRASLR